MGFWQAYKALTPEQRRVLKTKALSIHRSVDDTMAMLQPLAAYDTVGDRAQKTFGCTALLCVPLIVISMILNKKHMFPSRTTGYYVVVALIGLLIVSGLIWKWTRSLDISNSLRQFVMPVIVLLREDVEAFSKISLKLDLGSPTAKEKLKRRSDPYRQGVYHKVIDTFYVNPWVTAEMPLADGSTLDWTITDLVRARSKTKRNARGKTKTKTKYTTKSAMTVTLTVRNEDYSVESGEGRVRAGEKKKSIRVKGRSKRENQDALDPLPFIDLVAGIYQRTTPAGKAR
jgi:hypothetical protein